MEQQQRLGRSTAEFAGIVGISESLLKQLIHTQAAEAPEFVYIKSRLIVVEDPAAYFARMKSLPAKPRSTPRSPGRPKAGESREQYGARVQANRDQRTARAS